MLVYCLFQEATADEKTLQDLGAAATAVTKALNDLLQHIKKGTGDREVGVAFWVILPVSDRCSFSCGSMVCWKGGYGEFISNSV